MTTGRHEDRMSARFGLEPACGRRDPTSPRWLSKRRGRTSEGVEQVWRRRFHSGGLVAGWDHVNFWEREGWRYITTEPYRIEPGDLYALLTEYLGGDWPEVCVDVYGDEHIWADWTSLAVLRLAVAPALAPGATFSTQFGKERAR